MDTEILRTISSISTDAIKILGPAAITAFVGFKAGKAQLELKIKEMESSNKFKAREHLFKYHKEWQSHISRRYDQLTETLGSIAGVMAADKDGEMGLNPFALKFFGSYIKSAPHDVEMAIRDLENYKEKYKLEYELLLEHKIQTYSLRRAGDIDTVFRTIADLIEIYGHLNRCAHLLVEEEAKKALKPYLKEGET